MVLFGSFNLTEETIVFDGTINISRPADMVKSPKVQLFMVDDRLKAKKKAIGVGAAAEGKGRRVGEYSQRLRVWCPNRRGPGPVAPVMHVAGWSHTFRIEKLSRGSKNKTGEIAAALMLILSPAEIRNRGIV